MYKIAVGSSDGRNVDLKFGQADRFHVFQVDGKEVKLLGVREAKEDVPVEGNVKKPEAEGSCGTGNGCGNGQGCGGNGQGCGGSEEVLRKVSVIEDCRCVVCAKVGFQAQKQFEKKAISVFDVQVSIDEALEKITSYYYKIDQRQSLRKKLLSEET